METVNSSLSEIRTPHLGKRVYVYFVLLALCISGTVILKARWEEHVIPRQVVVEGIDILSKDDVLHLMKLPVNVSSYDLDLTTIQQNILANSFVKSVVVRRDSPDRLLVDVTERTPAAILLSNGMFYVDEDGIVLPYLATTEKYDIPVITGLDSAKGIRSGMRLTNQDLLDALQIIRTAKEVSDGLAHSISEIRVRKGHDIVLYTADAGIPIIFGKGDIAKKLVKLDAFRRKFLQNISTTDIQYIDIRFDDQVVVSHKTTS